MEPVIDTVTRTMNPSAVAELIENNVTMPNISKVIYNLKTEEPVRDEEGKKVKNEDGTVKMKPLDRPILATIVQFIDNTEVSVKNSIHDEVDLVEVMLDADGNVTKDQSKAASVIKTASQESKERGFIYCIIKRIMSVPDADGKMVESGLGRILHDIVTSAQDQVVCNAKQKLQRAAAKTRYAELKKNFKPKQPNPSLAKVVVDLSQNVKDMADIIAALKADIAELKAR